MNIDKDFFQKYYIIKYNDKIIASGKFNFVKGKKQKLKRLLTWPDNCISLDNKYFFNTGSKKFKIENVNYIQNFILSQNELRKYFQIELWKNCSLNPTADIFLENTINQLDEQIIPLIKAINKLSDIETTGSCSGHNKYKPYIDIRFSSLNALHYFLILLQLSNLNEKLVIQSSYRIDNNILSNDMGIVLCITTVQKKGNQAYELFNKFAEFINLRTLI